MVPSRYACARGALAYSIGDKLQFTIRNDSAARLAPLHTEVQITPGLHPRLRTTDFKIEGLRAAPD